MRKLLSVFTAVLVFFGSSLIASPASAGPDVTNPTNFDQSLSTLALSGGRTLILGRAFTYSSDIVSGFNFGAEIVDDQGSPSSFQTIAWYPASTNVVDYRAFETKSGKFVVGWSTFSAAREAVLNVATSDTGLSWSAISHPTATYVPPTGNCAVNVDNTPYCGFENLVWAQASTGRVALSYTVQGNYYQDAFVDAPLSISTTTNFTNWTKAVKVTGTKNSGYSTWGCSLTGISGGRFLVNWARYTQNSVVAGTGIWKSGKTSLQSATATKASSNVDVLSRVISLSSTLGIRMMLNQNNGTVKYGYQKVNLSTGALGAVTWISTHSNEYVNGFVDNITDLSGVTSVVYTAHGDNGNGQVTSVRRINFSSTGVPSAEYNLIDLTDRVQLTSIGLDTGNNLFFTEYSYLDNVVRLFPVEDNVALPPGEISPVAADSPSVQRINNTDLLYIYRNADDYNVYAGLYRPDRAPTATALPKITGTVKRGKTLTSSAPTFDSINGIGTNTYQWFACETASSKVVYNAVPGGCTEISGATGRTYRINADDAGYYLAVKVSNTNQTGTTSLFSKTTTKVK